VHSSNSRIAEEEGGEKGKGATFYNLQPALKKGKPPGIFTRRMRHLEKRKPARLTLLGATEPGKTKRGRGMKGNLMSLSASEVILRLWRKRGRGKKKKKGGKPQMRGYTSP